MKLIDKSALVAELKKRIRDYWSDSENTMGIYPYALEEVIKYIDTLEVKEVDLEKALSDLDKDIKEFVTTEEFENESTTAGHYWVIAKHAFLLGLKAQKGE